MFTEDGKEGDLSEEYFEEFQDQDAMDEKVNYDSTDKGRGKSKMANDGDLIVSCPQELSEQAMKNIPTVSEPRGGGELSPGPMGRAGKNAMGQLPAGVNCNAIKAVTSDGLFIGCINKFHANACFCEMLGTTADKTSIIDPPSSCLAANITTPGVSITITLLMVLLVAQSLTLLDPSVGSITNRELSTISFCLLFLACFILESSGVPKKRSADLHKYEHCLALQYLYRIVYAPISEKRNGNGFDHFGVCILIGRLVTATLWLVSTDGWIG